MRKTLYKSEKERVKQDPRDVSLRKGSQSPLYALCEVPFNPYIGSVFGGARYEIRRVR